MDRSETAESEATVKVGGAFNKGNIRRFLLSPNTFTLRSLLRPAVGQSDHISDMPLPSHRHELKGYRPLADASQCSQLY